MAAMKFGLYNLLGMIFWLLVQIKCDDIWAVSKNLCNEILTKQKLSVMIFWLEVKKKKKKKSVMIFGTNKN